MNRLTNGEIMLIVLGKLMLQIIGIIIFLMIMNELGL